MPKARQSQQTITVDVSLRAAKGEETPVARAYLFDHEGTLLDSKPLSGKLTFTAPETGRHRVVVGPDLPIADRSHAELAAELDRAGAVSRDVGRGFGSSVSLAVPPSIYRCWSETCIFVHGSVRKETSPGVYAPICAGIVQIFQVDLGCTLDKLASFTDAPLWYALVADVLEGGLDRAAIIDRIRLIPNLPDPPPDTFHETTTIVESPVARRLRTQAMDVANLPAVANAPVAGVYARAARTADATGAMSAAAIGAPVVSSALELSSTLRSLPASALKDTLVANKAILAPFLCWLIPDWWFCWQELGEAKIQSDGTFSAEICFWCPADFPDLYFEVIQTVGGIEREISDPQIACSTYYDYDGSRDVVITVDDPTAVACNDPRPRPIPGKDYYVWPQSIGNVDLRGINGLESAPGGLPQGLLGSTPWAGTLALKMEFDPRLKPDGIAKYYRWSYKFDGDPDWSPINAPVTHRYQTVTYVPFLEIHTHPVNLGPKPPVGGESNLFEIPDPFPGDGWVNISDPWDVPFAYFDTTDNHYAPFSYTDALPRRSGLCTLLLELFDAGGTRVKCGNNGVGGPFVFVLPDLGGSPSDYTSALGPHNITAQGQLVFRVLIDNNDTYAKVDTITAGGAVADACGILHYGTPSDNVAIGFHATHPNGYLTWALQVWRGASGIVASTSGTSSSPPQAPNPFSNTAAALLGGCTNAAFAADLWTWTTATDGYGRQSQYDRFDSHPFALLHP
jgi:hypothetical protein